MQVNLTEIIMAVIALIGTVLTGYVIPVLKSKVGENNQKTFDKAVQVAVYAAEQIYTGLKQGKEKKEYVKELLQNQGYNVDFQEVDAAIEAQVRKMKNSVEYGIQDS